MISPVRPVTLQCERQPTLRLRVALGLIGFSAVLGQIVLMRELIVVFNGNEISLGIMLATWLFWTAVGSMLSSGWGLGVRNPRRSVALLECLLALSLPPTIWVVRASKAFFQAVPGELVGLVPMVLTSLMCLSVFCTLCGALFVVASRMYEQECGVSARIATSSAYWLEAVGSAVGGIIAGALLLRIMGPFRIAMIVLLANIGMAAVLTFARKRAHIVAVIAAAGVLAIPLSVVVAHRLHESSQERLWQGFHVIGSRDSTYGNLVVTRTGDIRSVYENGVILGSAPDPSAAEEAVHYALLEHSAPRNVLLIGGGAIGAVAEALKHPTVEHVDYVELDPALIRLTRQFFPQQAGSLLDARVNLHYADGRYFLNTTDEKYDVIIINLPDPQTAQLNRFYTAEFFQSAPDHLASGGLLAVQLRSSEDYISPDLAQFLRCIHHTLRQGFPYVVMLPGGTAHFFAATQPNVLTEDPQVLTSRLQDRRLETQYVREYFIPFRLAADRMAQSHDLLQPSVTTPVNHDFEPIAYYFDVVLWSAQFKEGYSRWFRIAAQIPFVKMMVGVLITAMIVALFAAYVPARETRTRASAVCSVAATGFTLMALQVLILLAFQAVYGYVFHQLSILIAMFMAGIALGNWLGMRALRLGSQSLRALASTQLGLAMAAPTLILVIRLLSQISKSSGTLWAAEAIFPALAALGGMLGGYQFPIASEIYLSDVTHGSVKTNPGLLYGIDLIGGCVGALLLSSYLIPVFGFWKTAWLSAAVNLGPVLLAARVAFDARGSRA